MQELTQVFNYQSKEVRTVIKDGEPWFVAKDVCDILEIKNPSDAMSRLDEDEKNTIVLNEGIGNPERSIVSESGLYNLILGSRKPEAKQFKRWITHEVIPSICKTGTYSAQPKTAIEALQQTVKVLTEHETRIEKLENTMTIDYTQQEIIRELCNATVTKVLGGKDSNAYKLVQLDFDEISKPQTIPNLKSIGINTIYSAIHKSVEAMKSRKPAIKKSKKKRS